MIEEIGPDSPYYKQVVELGDANSKTLGFLPYEAISHAAAEGRVLAYIEDNVVKGYALFGKRARTGDISLTHLCVAHSERGRGIARQLVEGIVERHQHRAAIRLSCRKDYAADAMWPHLGFQRIGEKPGRSRQGLPLVTWIRPIAARTLFEEPEQDDARMVVAIDTNILLDILEQRDFPASLALTADWVAEAAELVATEQSRSELSDRRARSESFASALGEYHTLAPAVKAWQVKLRALQDEHSIARLGDGDLRVIAQAAAAGADYLVSRDQALLQRGEGIEKLTGLRLVGPDDFLLRLQALGGEPGSRARTIAASGMSVSRVSEMPSNAELSAFCHHHVSERPSELRQRLSLVTAREGRIELLATEAGAPLALGAMYRDQDQVIVTALRGAGGQRSYVMVRQMVHHLRRIAATEGPATIMVDDQTDAPVERALRDEGFRPSGSAWKAVVRTGILEPDDALPPELDQVGWDRLTAHLVREYERYAWLSKVFSGGIASYMVPIKPEYARVILGYEELQAPLFELHLGAAAARDNVYYMSPRWSIEAPARIIWWVSGGKQSGGVRAMSWLDEVDTGDPHRLYRKYRDRGVLDEQQVLGSAKPSGTSGHPAATAMLFSQTEVFRQPVPIARARELCDSMNRKGFFITTQTIDEDAVRRLYEEGVRRHED